MFERSCITLTLCCLLIGPPCFGGLQPASAIPPSPAYTVGSRDPSASDSELAPLSPSASMDLVHLADGFRLELVACEPQVMDPIAVDWDLDGRLWVVEMADYPYGMDGNGMPGGRIRFLEDPNRDGFYEQSTLFLDGINFPTSVMAWNQGVLVTAAPEVFYAEDSDGDGRADVKRVLFKGFIEGNQQLRVNSLRWGLDKWVYAASGGHHAGFGKATKIFSVFTGSEYHLGSGDFRMRPDKGELEPLSGPSQYGRVRDDWGHWFGVQNSFPLWHFVLEDRYLRRNPDVAAPDPRKQLRLPPNPKVYPIKPVQKRFHSFEQSGRFTSACGPCIYRDDLLFPDYPEATHAFTCEPFHNVVQHHRLFRDSASFSAERAEREDEPDFFASADRWCRPVMSRTGPDGALYIVDMYRYMIEHPDWLPEEGRKELFPYYRFGEFQGRIYRIVPKHTDARSAPIPVGNASSEIAQALVSPNGIVRDWAHRKLSAMEPIPTEEVRSLSRSHPNPKVRLQAMGLLVGKDSLTDQDLSKALSDPNPFIRRAAIQWAESAKTLSESTFKGILELVEDPDASVRLQLACSLGEWPRPEASAALVSLALRADADHYMQSALISSFPIHFEAVAQTLVSIPVYSKALMQMSASRPDRLRLVLGSILPADVSVWNESSVRLCSEFLDVIEDRGRIESILPKDKDERVGSDDSLSKLADFLSHARNWYQDSNTSIHDKVLCVGLLGFEEQHFKTDLHLLADGLRPNIDPRLRSACIQKLSNTAIPGSVSLLLSEWSSFSPGVKDSVLNTLSAQKENTGRILDAVRDGRIPTNDISPAFRQQWTNHPDTKLADQATILFRPKTSQKEDVTKAVQKASGLDGDVPSGRILFEQRCAVCHELDGLGNPIGPDLRSLTDRGLESILSAVLDPNQNAEPRYLAYTVTLENDEQVYGMIVSESGNSIVMKTLDGMQREILVRRIASVTGEPLSFMPENLVSDLTPQDLKNLVVFIQEKTR